MDHIVAILEKIRSVTEKEFRASEGDRRFLTIIGGVFLPIIIGVWGAFLPAVFSYAPWVAVIGTILLGMFQLAVAWRTLDKPQTLGTALSALAAVEGRLGMEAAATAAALEEAGRLSVLQSWALALYTIQAATALDPQASETPAEEFFEKFLSTMRENPGQMFGFSADDIWNFVVYLHDPIQDELRPVWRCTDARHPSRQGVGDAEVPKGRSWKPGIGHVGLAFRRNEALITEDAAQASVRQLFVAPGDLHRPYDETHYRSFASIPFGGDQPVGVLVGTSSRMGAFDDRTSLPLRHAATVFGGLSSIIKDLKI